MNERGICGGVHCQEFIWNPLDELEDAREYRRADVVQADDFRAELLRGMPIDEVHDLARDDSRHCSKILWS